MPPRSPDRRELNLGDGRTRLMGVLNITPNSFSDGGRFLDPSDAVEQGLALVEAGADVLDIGGESTRPGYDAVSAEVQIERVLPVLNALRPRTDVPISIDTTRAAVAKAALAAGADWVNDTTALSDDAELAAVVADHDCEVVLMHRFTPGRTGGDAAPSRDSVMAPIVANLADRVEHAVRCGIKPSRIILDPGIGFGTRPEDNLVIHAHIRDLAALGHPIVVGSSRKSFLGHVTGRATEQRLAGTAASVALLALAGVELVRVHDVAEMRDVVTVVAAIQTHTEPATQAGAM